MSSEAAQPKVLTKLMRIYILFPLCGRVNGLTIMKRLYLKLSYEEFDTGSIYLKLRHLCINGYEYLAAVCFLLPHYSRVDRIVPHILLFFVIIFFSKRKERK